MTKSITPDSLLLEFKHAGLTSWNIIAICASDPDQASGYRLLGQTKYGSKLRVFADLPGPKIGNGGALLQCLKELCNEFGLQQLSKLRILFIPAGGMSQRSPWLSALGKLFAVLPTTFGYLDMLDITVALTEPFARIASNGCVFVAASDVILPYKLSDEELVQASQHLADADFVALAHQTNDLLLASSHGVYCLSPDGSECRRVLQKPSASVMHSAGAFLPGRDGEVLVDSDFWLSGCMIEVLLNWYDTNKFRIELDAYGDFLRALGHDAILDYAEDARNLSQPSPESIADLAKARTSLFALLRPRRLRLLRLEPSALVHIGSTSEYLAQLYKPTPLARSFSCLGDLPIQHDHNVSLICCRLNGDLQFQGESALEFCKFSLRAGTIGRGCLLSHCFCNAPQEILCIPDGWVLQSVPLCDGSFVTWALHASDNPKQRDADTATFLGESLKKFLVFHGIIDKFVWGGSLWSAQIFPHDHLLDASQSFLATVRALQDHVILSKWLAEKPHRRLLSISDIVAKKDTAALVNFRRSLQ